MNLLRRIEDLVDRVESGVVEGIMKGINGTQVKDTWGSDSKRAFEAYGLKPRGFAERVGYGIGWYIERTA